MSDHNIWICPANSKNLQKTIKKTYKGKYLWAMNATRGKSFNELNLGDICLFGNLIKDGQGFTHMGIVDTKEEIDESEDDWPFKSPSGTHWKHMFTLSLVCEINISPTKARELRGWNGKQGWQSQTKLSDEYKKNFNNYLWENYPKWRIYLNRLSY